MGSDWPPSEFRDVRAYVYDWTQANPLYLVDKGKLHPGVINRDGAILTRGERKALFAAIDSEHHGDRGANCYSPHHGFVFSARMTQFWATSRFASNVTVVP